METVRIIYSKEENVTFCMWKYFFDSCGVWVMPQDSNQNQEDDDRPKLYILSEKDKMQIKSDEMPQTVYLVSQELYNMLEPYEQKRSDIIVISWQKAQMRKNAQRAFLILTESNEESSDLYELYDIFLRYELWGMAWLFNEMKPKQDYQGCYYEKCIWDKNIYTACGRAIADMESIKNKYSDFAKIYYYYIEKNVEYRQNLKERWSESVQIFSMLKEYNESYKKNNNFNFTAFNYLGAQNCVMGLEQGMREYCLKIIKPEDYTSELVFEIAKELERKYTDSKEVSEWYNKMYSLNPKNYKVVYELCTKYLKIGAWQESLTLYEELLKYVRAEKKYSCISTSHIEYEYKITGRISDIYFEKVKARDIARDAQLSLKRMDNNLKDRTEFDMILKCMFENEDDRILYFNGIIHHIKYRIFSEVPFNFLAI